MNEIEVDFAALGQFRNVSRITLQAVPTEHINIREIEIYPLKEIIHLYKWDGSSWGSDIIRDHTSEATVTATNASYITTGLKYGKYKTVITVEDLNGNSTQKEHIFYIDEPEFSVSQSHIDLGKLSHS